MSSQSPVIRLSAKSFRTWEGSVRSASGWQANYLLVENDKAIMIFAYSKAEQGHLTPEQKKAFKALMKEMSDGQESQD